MLAALTRVLSPFFDAQGRRLFVDLQQLTGALISGSTAISFFNDTMYRNSDLDVYVEHDKHAPLINFLLEEGYTFIPSKKSNSHSIDTPLFPPTPPNHIRFEFDITTYDSESILSVYNFRRHDTGRAVQIIATSHCPLNTILNFHSTCVMNFISDCYAVSLYLDATFVYHVALANYRMTHINDSGWKYVTRRKCAHTLDYRSVVRRVGDEFCWVVDLWDDVEDHHNLQCNTWTLSYTCEDHIRFDFGVMQSLLFNLSYCVAGAVRDRVPIYANGWYESN
ncbi:uncharacterized protein EV420DRAFT_1282049 [Desarmillaria tabescens]|uniref:Uncharacterized protein n=1 Tax=Armillaria tabescens TaxID=1929756 RepID=A0AA39MHY3_ARMTA|nr:uncharacterized protein EV420DRAFT_1282049 [Desarmillaria tabescens]KAK0435002.1 hypothetical protein EV420DRAFT_1282049 [Desarmillaria tabescens]